MRLSEHFTLEELTVSETAVRRGIDNEPPPAVVQKLVATAHRMEKVRIVLGGVVIIVLSGYRSPELNRAVGGAPTSQHVGGEACDFIAPAFGTPLAICQAIERNREEIAYDQLIWEGTWVHISFTDTPRLEVLTWKRGEGYSKGLPS